jgi:hypothetical protein
MKTGRKPHVPSDQERRTVETMASHGIPPEDIARVIGITRITLLKWYQYELDTGQTKANSMVAQSLYQKAIGNGAGSVTACIFWLKVRAGWVEPQAWETPAVGKKEQARVDAGLPDQSTSIGALIGERQQSDTVN